jgi:hypothetical protein
MGILVIYFGNEQNRLGKEQHSISFAYGFILRRNFYKPYGVWPEL